MKKLVEDKLAKALSSFLGDRRGNVMMIFAFAVIPMLIMGGMAIDYARDAMVHGRMAAVADAAALAATTPELLSQSDSASQTAAENMFAAQAKLVSGFTYDPTKLTVDVQDTQGLTGIIRQVIVTYPVTLNNFFGHFDSPQTTFTVSSTAKVSTAPNINFYLLLDSSPSMEIPATSAGIQTMVNTTGCALACHEQDYKDSEYTIHYSGWGQNDSYSYAENNGITLRIDNMRAAAQELVTLANQTMSTNQAVYQMSAHTFSDGATELLGLTEPTKANITSMQNAISGIMPPLMANNNTLAQGSSYTYPTASGGGRRNQSRTISYQTVTLPSATSNDDAGTNFDNALNIVNAFMPTPGNGTNATGDAPQGALLIVTDGVDDVSLYNSSACNTSEIFSYSNNYGSFARCEQPVNTAICATIKARGIRIGVLYTTYYPLTGNSWYDSTVAPFISQVQSNLESCASSPDLFFEVSTDGDITAALNQLFLNVVNSAPHLVQ